MPYTAPHNVLQIIGSITSGGIPEQWTNVLRFGEGNYLMGGSIPASPDPDPKIILDQIEADLVTWWTQMQNLFPTKIALAGFKFNAVDVNGRYISQAETHERFFPGGLPGVVSTMLPTQCAVVVTLRTAAERGLAHRGRVFLPPLGASSLTSEGRITPDARNSCSSQLGLLLTNLNNWTGIDAGIDPGTVCIMSKVRTGATRRVTRTDCGDLFDTQRSRRESLVEVRSPVTAVAS